MGIFVHANLYVTLYYCTNAKLCFILVCLRLQYKVYFWTCTETWFYNMLSCSYGLGPRRGGRFWERATYAACSRSSSLSIFVAFFPADTELETRLVRSEDVDTQTRSHFHITSRPLVCVRCASLYNRLRYTRIFTLSRPPLQYTQLQLSTTLIQCPHSPLSLIHHSITDSCLLQLMLERKY